MTTTLVLCAVLTGAFAAHYAVVGGHVWLLLFNAAACGFTLCGAMYSALLRGP
jgi:hypothetical protein